MTAGGALRRLAAMTLTLWIAAAPRATAGPPFVTDDPEPTDTGHWEIYNFVTTTHAAGATLGQGGFDINYGGARNLQLSATIPVDYQSGLAPAVGDIELAAKYRFVRQAPGTWLPDISFFPRVFTPTAPRRFGPRVASLFLPVWAQKDFGEWSLFGGGGYQINPGADGRNAWLTGLAITRAVGKRLTLGVEAYHQTPVTRDDRPFTGLNLGVIYRLTEHWSLLGAAGPGLQNAAHQGLYNTYISLEATY